MSTLEVESLQVRYGSGQGAVTALADFTLSVPLGHLAVLLGESGCGKTTALNAIAGLAEPDSGAIRLGGATLFEQRGGRAAATVPPNRRDIGMVFQSYALWPHLTVRDNVMYPLRRRHVANAEAEKAALAALAMVRCDQFAQRHPGELSGGQQQRVALARALAARPKLLLFDEPLSNLDAGLRRGLRNELARLHREIGFTGVYVTHDQSEALSLGTDVAVMDGGRIVQFGAPAEIFERPETEFVARFFGANIVPGRVVARSGGGGRVETPIGAFESTRIGGEAAVAVAFMPHAAVVEAAADGPLMVASAMYLGTHREYRLTGGDLEVLAIQPAGFAAPPVGARARLRLDAASVHVFSQRPETRAAA